MDTLRIARLELRVARLQWLLVASTLVTIATAIVAVLAHRPPREIRIGPTRIDELGIALEQGDAKVYLEPTGVFVTDRESWAELVPSYLRIENLRFVAEPAKLTVGVWDGGGHFAITTKTGIGGLHLTTTKPQLSYLGSEPEPWAPAK